MNVINKYNIHLVFFTLCMSFSISIILRLLTINNYYVINTIYNYRHDFRNFLLFSDLSTL